jgi:hypothetical protein
MNVFVNYLYVLRNVLNFFFRVQNDAVYASGRGLRRKINLIKHHVAILPYLHVFLPMLLDGVEFVTFRQPLLPAKQLPTSCR